METFQLLTRTRTGFYLKHKWKRFKNEEEINMKKFLPILLILSLGISMTGCGKTDNVSNQGGTPETKKATEAAQSTETGGVVDLKMWVHVTDETDEGKVYAERVAAFNEAHDNINVSVEFIPRAGGGSGYEDKINTAVTTNQLPDIITLDGPNAAAYVDSGIIAPIGDYISKESLDDYLPSIIEQGTVNGQLYGLGAMESTVGLYYNEDILNKYGIKPGSMDNIWTWDDLLAAGEKITKGENYPALEVQFNWTGEWKIYAFAPFVWSNGGNVISEDGLTAAGIFNSQENAEALGFIKKLVDGGIATATPEENSFHLGKSAFMLNGPWAMPDLEKNYPDIKWAVMPYPVSSKTKELHVPTGSWQFAATSQSKHVAEAAQVVEWMTNTESVVAMTNAIGMPPARKSAVEFLPAYQEGARKVMLDQLAQGGHARPVSPIYPVVSRNFEEAIDAVIYGEDPQTVLNQKVQVIEREAKRKK